MHHSDKIYIAGHSGLVGSSIIRNLTTKGFNNLITKSHKELDLTNQDAVNDFFSNEKPKYVILAAAKVGGIYANNTYPADFIYENIMIQTNVINSAYQHNAMRLLFLGSTCIYPRYAKQPIKEKALLSNYLEPTNEAYAIAKIAGIKLCESYNRQYGTDFRSIMPTNLYGINDNFDIENSHVIPGLIRRFHEAKINNQAEVIVWGSGKALREFLYVDDMADACIFLMSIQKSSYQLNTEEMISHINVGTGVDLSIYDLAKQIKKVTEFKGKIIFDKSKPDGPPRKCTDISRLSSLGWEAKTSLQQGLSDTYKWYITQSKI